MLVSIYTFFFLALRCVGGMLDGLTSLKFRMPFRLRTKNSFGEMESSHFGILGNAEDINCAFFDCLVFTTTLL